MRASVRCFQAVPQNLCRAESEARVYETAVWAAQSLSSPSPPLIAARPFEDLLIELQGRPVRVCELQLNFGAYLKQFADIWATSHSPMLIRLITL